MYVSFANRQFLGWCRVFNDNLGRLDEETRLESHSIKRENIDAGKSSRPLQAHNNPQVSYFILHTEVVNKYLPI